MLRLTLAEWRISTGAADGGKTEAVVPGRIPHKHSKAFKWRLQTLTPETNRVEIAEQTPAYTIGEAGPAHARQCVALIWLWGGR